jgi:hypothetical protein
MTMQGPLLELYTTVNTACSLKLAPMSNQQEMLLLNKQTLLSNNQSLLKITKVRKLYPDIWNMLF